MQIQPYKSMLQRSLRTMRSLNGLFATFKIRYKYWG
jgi:hypothetical protein